MGRLVEASNATFYCDLLPPEAAERTDETESQSWHCVYKPIRGERPLDDFPRHSLAAREVAAFELSEASFFQVVPPTVLRDGPLGPGMLQWWIDTDEQINVLELILTRDQKLRRMALFDAVVNNADRKGGHILPAEDGHLYGCDHGVCFAVEPKLRTVLWGWRGDTLSADELACLDELCRDLQGALGARLGQLLTAAEVRATAERAERLIRAERMPIPDPYRPAIPWPPF